MGELNKLPVERAIFWLLSDALVYARLEVFGGYLNKHKGLDLVDHSAMDDQRELLLFKLGRSAVSYLHATTTEEDPYTRAEKMLAELNKEDDPAP